ncbi:MAG: glycosyltransferase family 2 protein [Leptospiraceae bacterium]|nr:glycosyltransferase family 2 protein [Leptospiraceae bacterium]MDW7976745.1 glycosyltransferase family 2 protein [Leptospiraceae bacterium]
MKEPTLSVIIPCYNEEKVIEETFQRLSKVLSKNFRNYELIFINDGSTDKTLEILESIASKDKRVKIISFSRNFGHQPAVVAGLDNCKGNYAVIIDADLQDPPELIPEMYQLAIEKKANVVYGVRVERKGETFFKKYTAWLFYKIINFLSDVPLPENTGDFRLIDQRVIEEFRKLPEKNKYIRGLISWIGFKQIPYYYVREPRFAGETKYPLSKMIRFAMTALLYFSKKPLKLATSLGFISILLGLVLTVYVFLSIFLRPEIVLSGWASTIITIIFFGGVQLLTIGLIGEYIGSIFDEIKNRPIYIIDKKINF